MEKIIIYTNEQCPYCGQVKEELTKNNIEFENRITSEFEEDWKSITNLTNIGTVPTIVYKDNYFVSGRDFGNSAHLIAILNDFEESNFSIEKQIIEKIKTLNYNMSMAFNRTDQLLRQIENKLNIEENEHKSTS